MSTTFMKRCCDCLPCEGCCQDALTCFGDLKYVSHADGAEPVFSDYSESWSYKVIDPGFETEDLNEHLVNQTGPSTFSASGGPVFTCGFTFAGNFRATGYEKDGATEKNCVIDRAIDLECAVVPNDWCPQPGLKCKHVSFLFQPNPEGTGGWPRRDCANGASAVHVSLVTNLPAFFCGLDADLGGFPFGGAYDQQGNWWESWGVEYIETNEVTGVQKISRLSTTAALGQNAALCVKSGGARPECP